MQDEKLSGPFPEQKRVAVSELRVTEISPLRFPINHKRASSTVAAGGEERGEKKNIVLGIKRKKRRCHYQVSLYKSKFQKSVIKLGAQSSDGNAFF